MRRCPIEIMIPVYLVVGGIFFLLKISFKIYEELLEANKQLTVRQSLQAAIWWRIASAVVSMFLFAWFIAGTTMLLAIVPRMYVTSGVARVREGGTLSLSCFNKATGLVSYAGSWSRGVNMYAGRWGSAPNPRGGFTARM